MRECPSIAARVTSRSQPWLHESPKYDEDRRSKCRNRTLVCFRSDAVDSRQLADVRTIYFDDWSVARPGKTKSPGTYSRVEPRVNVRKSVWALKARNNRMAKMCARRFYRICTNHRAFSALTTQIINSFTGPLAQASTYRAVGAYNALTRKDFYIQILGSLLGLNRCPGFYISHRWRLTSSLLSGS